MTPLIVHFTSLQLAVLVAITADARENATLRDGYGVTADEAIALSDNFASAQPGFVHIPPTCADLLLAELGKIQAASQEGPEHVRMLANAAAKIDAARGR